jgi:hypothetical protein
MGLQWRPSAESRMASLFSAAKRRRVSLVPSPLVEATLDLGEFSRTSLYSCINALMNAIPKSIAAAQEIGSEYRMSRVY